MPSLRHAGLNQQGIDLSSRAVVNTYKSGEN